MKSRHDLIEVTYSVPGYRIAVHVLFWLLMGLSYYYFNTISFTPASGTAAAAWLAVKNVTEYAFAFYTLMYWIWPLFIYRKKWLAAMVLLFAWLVAVTALDAWIDQKLLFMLPEYADRMNRLYSDYYNFLQRSFSNIVFIRVLSGGLLYHLLMQLSFPVAIKIGRSYFRQTVQSLQLAKDNIQLEFNFLKSQVNPHFLFNTLNNLYSLVATGRNTEATGTIARLSGFMRYALYETGDATTSLNREVQLMQDYIELEKLRLNETSVSFVAELDSDAYRIPPLLLMPAMENAFKYTADKKSSRIAMELSATGGILNVSILNTYDASCKRESGGIGLHNLLRRLEHHYGKGAEYSASAANGVYLFHLRCPLQ